MTWLPKRTQTYLEHIENLDSKQKKLTFVCINYSKSKRTHQKFAMSHTICCNMGPKNVANTSTCCFHNSEIYVIKTPRPLRRPRVPQPTCPKSPKQPGELAMSRHRALKTTFFFLEHKAKKTSKNNKKHFKNIWFFSDAKRFFRRVSSFHLWDQVQNLR